MLHLVRLVVNFVVIFYIFQNIFRVLFNKPAINAHKSTTRACVVASVGVCSGVLPLCSFVLMKPHVASLVAKSSLRISPLSARSGSSQQSAGVVAGVCLPVECQCPLANGEWRMANGEWRMANRASDPWTRSPAPITLQAHTPLPPSPAISQSPSTDGIAQAKARLASQIPRITWCCTRR